MLGFDGDLVILHDEEEPPYDRPSCAKGLLTGHSRPSDVKMPIMPGVDAHWKLGRKAVHLDTEAHMVITDTDEVFEYDGLVIATGAYAMAAPRVADRRARPARPVPDGRRLALRSELRGPTRSPSSAAASPAARWPPRSAAWPATATSSTPSRTPMAGPLGEHVGRWWRGDEGRRRPDALGRRVAGLNRARRGWTLILDDGEEITVDIVVAATGERPDTRWLQGCPDIDVSDGVLCDEALRVSAPRTSWPPARWPAGRTCSTRRRPPRRPVDHRAGARPGRGRHAALQGHPVEPVTHMPRFWSEQFGLRIQVCGETPTEAEVRSPRCGPGARTPRAPASWSGTTWTACRWASPPSTPPAPSPRWPGRCSPTPGRRGPPGPASARAPPKASRRVGLLKKPRSERMTVVTTMRLSSWSTGRAYSCSKRRNSPMSPRSPATPRACPGARWPE